MTRARPVATAGLRGAQWDPARLPKNVTLAAHALTTSDGANTSGFLFRRGMQDTVVCIMHPRESLVTHYLVPDILLGGAAVWLQAPRSPGNDIRLEHEIALHDVAAGLRFLCASGFKRIILLGNSGGAALYALYQQQAMLSPGARVARTPGGRPTRLAEAELPRADGMIFVSPHPGPGKLLLNCIDPSITDEADPFSVDPSLDPLSTANGYSGAPESASYAPDFVARYRAAQHSRVERLDAIARDLIAQRQMARKALAAGDASRENRILAARTPIMTIWRTDADLRCFDLSLDPSERRFGSLWGADPFISNWGAIGFGRICSPESWLSTWSGISSRARLDYCAPAIDVPTLLVEYRGDNCVFPSDTDAIFAALGSPDKQRIAISGDHHGRPVGEEQGGQLAAGEAIQTWLNDSFKTRSTGAI
jgi:pimeloyl-ACP methyl ester carboxylesterase